VCVHIRSQSYQHPNCWTRCPQALPVFRRVC